MILITGGARSGKSRLAEQFAAKQGDNVLYIATSIVTDDEMAQRIAIHQQTRPAAWQTHEGFSRLGNVIRERGAQHDAIMLECITTMITNLMFENTGDIPAEEMDFVALENKINLQIEQLIEGCQQCPCPVYIVTNEVGFGIVPENLLVRRFRDIAGRVNQRLAAFADEVYLVVSGIELKMKG
ncbi:Adenosylcobinamide-phosphate guanylyltransferase [Tolumonas auensis DSM 9187]|uniref:Bifunctional adenosylcobalamin biosynthesis protein n=1 Tax=Tolumonas auensis (strain DSM 9187 / NBRC 110442 / TA 4) TaxID=595494 RepID=C4LFA7_TOLAT|nr:bifunctional adenosylcobinamide kinase/adenosylcobinamide-phosphate guanylyltransferase [Tolumonas auensis]ACQ93274.1 Adenosylcobinamide-phosphate guanylyltransferase [Tolumonas auensis DSM 9187]